MFEDRIELQVQFFEGADGGAGVTEFYTPNGSRFVVFDTAYSEAYGFVGRVDPITGEPILAEEIDFTLYEVKTLEKIAEE